MGPTAAQARLVVPDTFQSTNATGATNIPFGRAVPLRVQMVYGQSLFQGRLSLVGIGFRPEPGTGSAAKVVDLELHAGSLAGGLTWMQPQFAQNRGKDFVEVVRRRKTSLLATARQAALPGFSVQLPFDRSYAYDPKKGALLFEMAVHSQPRGSYPLDATWLCGKDSMQFVGPVGCGPTGGQALALGTDTPRLMWGLPGNLKVLHARPKAATMLLMGSRASGPFAGVQLPFELSPLGAKGCHLSVDVLAAPRTVADVLGVATYSFQVPSVPQLRGMSVYVQGVAADAKANPLGLVSSQAARVEICGFEPVGRVFANGLTAAMGHRELGMAPVVQLTSR